jgi:serine/threonine-protein kinase
MSERDDASLVGSVLQDSYRLTRLIGAGGMGAVFEGVQLRLSKRVAVKLLVRELAANEEALARFRREAEVTSQLGHPHIVHVFDFGATPAGEPYLVMEYLEGEDLDHRLRRDRRMSLESTVHVVKQVASALAATHAKGVVHRDLKPANLFVLAIEGENDFVKVVDFGISKVKAATTRLTGASVVMGTPNYMSPEQAQGQVDDIDGRTDQWSLACIAYEMLAGRGPFVGENAASLLYQVIHQDPPPLQSRAPGVPRAVEKVLRRGLSKKMTDRFPSITEFSRALERAAGGRVAGEGKAPAGRTSFAKTSAEGGDGGAARLPTTFSQTASEVVLPLSRLRTQLARPRTMLAFVGVVAVLVGAAAFRPKSAPTDSPRVALPPQSAPAVESRAIVVPPPPPAAAPAHPSEPSPAAAVVDAPVARPRGSRPPTNPRSPTATAAAARPAGPLKVEPAASDKPKRSGWVDPFEQDDSPAPKKSDPDESKKRIPKPKRRLLEDL